METNYYLNIKNEKGKLKMSHYKFETNTIHSGQGVDETGSRALPIHQTTAYVFEDTQDGADKFALAKGGNIYTRINNPTQSVFETRMATLEGGTAAVATASGMSAITYAILSLAKNGDHIVSTTNLYGGTSTLFTHTLPEYGVETSFVDTDDAKKVDAAIQDNTKAVFLESIGNPKGDIPDLEAIAEVTKKHGVPLIVDNTFATPYLLRPIEHGADIVVHSATKFINGHGTSMGGVIIESGKFDWAQNDRFPSLVEPDPTYNDLSFAEAFGEAAYTTKIRAGLLRDTGASITPFNSWLLLQGLESLHVRMDRHVENAEKVAEYLENHEKVEWVSYAGLESSPYYELKEKYLPKGASSIFTFGVKGGYEGGKTFIEKLELFSLLANVGDSKSLVVHPASMTHGQLTEEELEAAGVQTETIRLSIGLENIDDILADLEKGLEAI